MSRTTHRRTALRELFPDALNADLWVVRCSCRWRASAFGREAAEREHELHVRAVDRRRRLAVKR